MNGAIGLCKDCEHWDGARDWGKCICPDKPGTIICAAVFGCMHFLPSAIVVDESLKYLKAD